MVLSDDPLTIRVSSNWTHEIPDSEKTQMYEVYEEFHWNKMKNRGYWLNNAPHLVYDLQMFEPYISPSTNYYEGETALQTRASTVIYKYYVC